MAHRIRNALAGELPEELNGVLEADETYIGGKPRKHISHATKSGQRAQDRSTHYDKKQAVFPLCSVAQRLFSSR